MPVPGSVRRWVTGHRLATYLLLTFLVTWSCWGVVLVVETPATTFLQLVGGLGPLVAAAVTARIAGDFRPWAAQLTRWRVPARWWVYAAVLPTGIVALVVALQVLAGGGLDPTRLPPVGTVVAIAVSTFLRGGLEEPGWRGMALPLLQERLNATVASVVLGVVWTTWHLPLFVTAGSSQAGSSLLVYGLGVLPLTVLLTVLYNNTRGSVLLAMVFHTVWNATQGIVGPAITAAGPVSPNLLVVLVLWGAALVAIGVHGVENLAGDRPTDVPRPSG